MSKGKKAVLWDVLFMLIGSAVYAVEVNAFTAPNNIAAGGVTGIAPCSIICSIPPSA